MADTAQPARCFVKCRWLVWFLVATLTLDGPTKINSGVHAFLPPSGPSPPGSPPNSPTTSPTNSPTNSPTPSPSPSPTNSPSPSPSPTQSPSPSPSPSQSPTNSPSPSPSPTQSPSPSLSPTNSPTPSPSPTQSPTSSPSPTNSPTSSPSSSPSPSATSSPSASSTPVCQAQVRRPSPAELDDHKHVRSLLSTKLLGRPRHVTALGLRNRAAACQADVDQLPLDADLEARRESAADPATIRARLGVTDVACPVVTSYHELSFTGTAGDAVRHWTAPEFADADVLDRATHFGLGVWQQSPDQQTADTSKGRRVSTFLLSVVAVTNKLSQCPPIDLPVAYQTPTD